MKEDINNEFVKTVLKLGNEYEVHYCIKYINLEVKNLETGEVKFLSIHEFIHTHCRDYLLSYSNGLKTLAETKHSDIDTRILNLHFNVFITVPNLLEGDNPEHVETFSGLSELMVYINAVNWLIQYRKDNSQLSKFWINKF